MICFSNDLPVNNSPLKKLYYSLYINIQAFFYYNLHLIKVSLAANCRLIEWLLIPKPPEASPTSPWLLRLTVKIFLFDLLKFCLHPKRFAIDDKRHQARDFLSERRNSLVRESHFSTATNAFGTDEPSG